MMARLVAAEWIFCMNGVCACRAASCLRVLCFCLSLMASAFVWAGGTDDAQAYGRMAERGDTAAAKFAVTAFKALPMDVSAFISPVYDLNGEACALVKVVVSADFAFSSPLGIVKRKNDTGEVWLYLPKGSKMLTIKHPQWGVLRNYRFPKPLESHVTYEMSVSTPSVVPLKPVKPDTVVLTKTVTDTVVVAKRKEKMPWAIHALATVALHSDGPSWGVMLAVLRRHGAFVHVQGDMRSVGSTEQTCNKEGFLPGDDVKPYYSGNSRHSNYAVTAGIVHRLCGWLNLFYGVGYGRTSTAWQLAESEGGGYVLNEGLSHKGVAAEAGLLLSFSRVSVSASALTVAGHQWQAAVGIGIRIGKLKRK